MICRSLAFVALAFGLASPAFADEATDSLVKAIEDAGCKVTAANGDAVYAASGLTEEEVFAAVNALYQQGLASLEADGSMTLKTGACQ